MDDRHRQAKVTLPPLSSLTTSIDMDRRHERPSGRRDSLIDRSDAMRLHDPPMSSSSFRDGSRALSVSNDRRWSLDRSVARHPPESIATFPPVQHSVPAASNPSISPMLRRTAMRSVVESTRPRSYSSPHRYPMPHPTRRSSLADTSEIDRLLESLIYVQDINRRLGLHTGCPASPSIFRNPGAADLLRRKIHEELSTMARFSYARAESVARLLGITADDNPSRAPESSSFAPRSSTSSTLSSGQAGYPMRPPSDYAERAQSSMGRLSLEEPRPSEYEYDSYSEAMETNYETDQGGYTPGIPSAYAMHPTRGEPRFRALSRATSFEHPRSVHQDQQHPHHYQRTTTELPRFGSSTRTPYDQPMQPPYGSGGLPPFCHPDSRQQQQQIDLLDRRRLAGKGMKRVRKRKDEHHQECLGCQAKETPEWRKGPMGPRTLCNACGLLYAKLTKRKLQEAEAAAKASGKSPEEIVREREESPGAKQASLEALRAELNIANGMRNRVGSSTAPAAGTPIGDGNPATSHPLQSHPDEAHQQRRHHPYM
ncbi:hypothetical protein NDA11_006881 [Ustilago hordei]|uniref:GATA-type domain-containing protein n=1 Tax=Ustilago hordei TaxID=120017 RepID=I2FPR9_USTHO|nr:uncharacterized protein UHO2_04617 [Ustilago hordei]KAJ1041642.1 hypothetical protein NDA10_001944 [Ustilago hordei]KAJ1575476.1 hypothetical protein NDA15_003474 [Ustilago hordei]KAJ1577321.1 hypothetical protein NDA12_006043 [Ustilago hordei]KAJ1595258.1 hypothetical protein NDA11_006881 [Ustilago hordei]KAJ1597102.1 hypothetical protein NDA14_005827 [Ustilago hordei]